MFKHKNKTGCETPKFRKSTVPPQYNPPPMPPVKPPNTGSSVVKPNPNYTPPPTVRTACTYETPCGWCTKWEKKCDKKIGGGNDTEPRKQKDAALEYIKSGKGLPPLDMNTTNTPGIRVEPIK